MAHRSPRQQQQSADASFRPTPPMAVIRHRRRWRLLFDPSFPRYILLHTSSSNLRSLGLYKPIRLLIHTILTVDFVLLQELRAPQLAYTRLRSTRFPGLRTCYGPSDPTRPSTHRHSLYLGIPTLFYPCTLSIPPFSLTPRSISDHAILEWNNFLGPKH